MSNEDKVYGSALTKTRRQKIFKFMMWAILALTSAIVVAESVSLGQQANTPALPIPAQHWTGDLDGMIKRREIRALVVNFPHAKSLISFF
jgi:hypothetical protein